MPDLLSISAWRNTYKKHASKFGWFLAALIGLPLVVGFGFNQFRGINQHNEANADLSKIVAKVNGEPITMGQFKLMSQGVTRQPGEEYAEMQGAILDRLVTMSAIQQEAKARNVKADDADIDRALDTEKESRLGKNASDAEWRHYVQQIYNKSLNEYREDVARAMVGPALLNNYKGDVQVTDEDAKKQSAEVKFNIVVIPTGSSPFNQGPKAPKPLPDADAKKKAEDLAAKVKAGAKIEEVAKANSADFTAKQGGKADFRPEFAGSLSYGKEFDEAVHKTALGQVTEVVKVAGFTPGYAFAKIAERRNNLPKDFDVKKVTAQLREQRASKKLTEVIQAKAKAAQVEVVDPDIKAYYDYFKWKQAQKLSDPMQRQIAEMQGQSELPEATPKAEVEKMAANVETEFEAMAKRSPKDATAALVLASLLKTKQFAPNTTQAQRDEIRDRLIKLYEVALETTENRDKRLELAGMYRDKKQFDLAEKHYTFATRLLNASEPFADMQSARDALSAHQQIMAGYRSINKLPEAEKEQQKVGEVMKAIADLQKKEEDERKRQAEEAKKSQTPPPGAPAPGGAAPTGKSTSPDIKVDFGDSKGDTKAPSRSAPKAGNEAPKEAPKSETKSTPDSGAPKPDAKPQ